MSGDETAVLGAALAALAPPSVRTGVRRIAAVDERALFPDERAAVRSAVPTRRQEFGSGRVLLRQLIGREEPIPVGADRAPVLSHGVLASLAHDREYVVAVVASDTAVRAVGVDLEPVGPLEPDVAALVVREDEAGLDPRLAFALKEATYKAWSALGGRMLEHHDVRVHLDGPLFRAVVGPGERAFTGRHGHAAGRWLALVVDAEAPDSKCRPGR